MKIPFYKYQGTGNDFIIIDDRSLNFPFKNTEYIYSLCQRRFGIGADGLILLQDSDKYDFKMVYFNADGHEGSMCGNGGRCIVSFAHFLGVFQKECTFEAIDGLHFASIDDLGIVSLQMSDVKDIEFGDGFTYLNTGSPHYVKFVNVISETDVFREGREIRYNQRFKKEGTNVNFVEKQESSVFVRTYERGVEDETYSCGTGVVASVLAFNESVLRLEKGEVPVSVLGGELHVSFEKDSTKYFNIFLQGKAERVFQGEIDYNH